MSKSLLGFILAASALACSVETGATGAASPADAAPARDGGRADAALPDGALPDAPPRRDAAPVADGGAPDGGPPPPPFCDPTDDTLALCLRFEGDLTDESMHGHLVVGTDHGFAGGVVGDSLEHDDSTAVWVRPSPALTTSPMSVELFVRADAFPVGQRAGLIDKPGELGLFIFEGGYVGCSFLPGVWITDPTPLPLGAFAHVACTYDGATAKLYRDGGMVGSQPVSRDTLSGLVDVRIGGNAPDGEPLHGRIDELRWFVTERSDAEIAEAAAR